MSEKGLRIIIAGGRDFSDYELLEKESLKIIKEKVKEMGLSQIPKEKITIISGTARGADSLGEKFASKFGLNLEQYPAQWQIPGEKSGYNRKAGYERNLKMAEAASQDMENYIPMLIAFWDEKSKGTNHMINIARNKNIETIIIEY